MKQIWKITTIGGCRQQEYGSSFYKSFYFSICWIFLIAKKLKIGLGVVEYLPSMYETLGSTPSTAKTKKQSS
jgi:hypothetical protein